MRERITGGLASGRRPRDFNAEQLRRGTRVELEHVVRPGRKPTKRDRELAREIAMDHLVEDPRYYTMLAKAEKRMKTRNKYDFKWWHGVLGLIGLSMVLGTVAKVSHEKAIGRTVIPYRGFEIVIVDTDLGEYIWSIQKRIGNDVQEFAIDRSTTRAGAESDAKWLIDTELA